MMLRFAWLLLLPATLAQLEPEACPTAQEPPDQCAQDQQMCDHHSSVPGCDLGQYCYPTTLGNCPVVSVMASCNLSLRGSINQPAVFLILPTVVFKRHETFQLIPVPNIYF